MKQLTIIVKPFKAEAVLKALAERGETDVCVREAKGYSRQKGYLDRYLGSEYSLAFIPKVEISAWVADDVADDVIECVLRIARTGRIGDGKVFVVASSWPEPIRF
jgi:nitrogen regulatory protein PII